MAGEIQPLDDKFPIVDEFGKPNLYFIQWCQSRQIDITEAITLFGLEEYLLAHQLQEGNGIALTPSGNLSENPTITVRNGTALNFDGSGNLKLADTAVTPGTYGDATHVGQFTVDQQGRITAASEVAISGGGGGGSTPTIRSYHDGVYNAASVAVSWPTGTVAGDVVIIYWENGYAVTTAPAGWTTIYLSNNGSLWTNQGCIAKVMTSADITAGSVTVTATGSFNGYWAALTIDGSTTPSYVQRNYSDSPGSTNTPSSAVTGMLGVSATDLMIGFASTRSNQTMTVSANMTVLDSAAGSDASGIIYEIDAAALGPLGMNETISAPTANNGLAWTTLAFSGP